MIRVPKQLLPLFSGYSQKQVKLVLLMINSYDPNMRKKTIFRHEIRNAFGDTINISDVSKKLVKSLSVDPLCDDDGKSPLIAYIGSAYPSGIEYTFRYEIESALNADDTECIEIDESLLAELPNTGYSLKLLLLLLSSAKNGSCTIPIADAGILLFGGQTAYMPNKANAAANQIVRLNQAVEDINTCTDYTVSVAPVKEHRSISGWAFTITTTASVAQDTVNPQVITQLLQKYDYDNPSEESTTFIALFCTNEGDAASMVRDIAKEATMLTRAGIMDSGEAYRLFTRKAPLYPHKKPVLWYTTPKVRPIFEHFIYAHPSRFMRYLTEIIRNCHSYREMLQFIRQEHLM